MSNSQSMPRPVPHLDAVPLIEQHTEVRWAGAIPGERVAIRIHGKQSGGRFSLLESVAAPGTGTPQHTHIEDEAFYVVSGVATFLIGERLVDVGAGGVVQVPARMKHAWSNRSDSDLRMVVVFAPGGVEELFIGLAGLEPAEIVTRAASFGTEVLGPPIAA